MDHLWLGYASVLLYAAVTRARVQAVGRLQAGMWHHCRHSCEFAKGICSTSCRATSSCPEGRGHNYTGKSACQTPIWPQGRSQGPASSLYAPALSIHACACRSCRMQLMLVHRRSSSNVHLCRCCWCYATPSARIAVQSCVRHALRTCCRCARHC